MSGIYFLDQEYFDTHETLPCGHSVSDSICLQAWSDGQYETLCLVVEGPCGCYMCSELGEIQPGHFACSLPTSDLLVMEENEEIYRTYQNGSWQWYLNRD